MGEIVTYMQSKLSAAAPEVATPQAQPVTPIAEAATTELPPHNEVALKKATSGRSSRRLFLKRRLCRDHR